MSPYNPGYIHHIAPEDDGSDDGGSGEPVSPYVTLDFEFYFDVNGNLYFPKGLT